MTPIERCKHLADYWQGIVLERAAELDEAIAERTKWRSKLVAAEIADKLSKENNDAR